MSTKWPADAANAVLYNSHADAISPLVGSYQFDPRAADGGMVIIADVDHIWHSPPQRG
jgi:hypothetical protein